MISQAGDLARRLARDAEAVCRHYLSNGRRSRPLLGRRRRQEHAGPQPLCPAPRSRVRPRRRRQMDRRRDRRAWRSARPDRPQPRPHPPRRGHGRGACLPRPAAAVEPRITDAIDSPLPSGSPEAARRLFRAGRPITRHSGRGLSARPRHHRPARLARLALPPVGLLPRRRGCSARNLAGSARRGDRSRRRHHRHPAHLARSAAARPRRRSPIRAGRSAICSATASASARPPTSSPPAKASRPCSRSNPCCPPCR